MVKIVKQQGQTTLDTLMIVAVFLSVIIGVFIMYFALKEAKIVDSESNTVFNLFSILNEKVNDNTLNDLNTLPTTDNMAVLVNKVADASIKDKTISEPYSKNTSDYKKNRIWKTAYDSDIYYNYYLAKDENNNIKTIYIIRQPKKMGIFSIDGSKSISINSLIAFKKRYSSENYTVNLINGDPDLISMKNERVVVSHYISTSDDKDHPVKYDECNNDIPCLYVSKFDIVKKPL